MDMRPGRVMRSFRRVTLGALSLLLASGCGIENPAGSATAGAPTPTTASPAAETAPVVPSPTPSPSSPAVESSDPGSALTGRAVEALGAGGVDVVMRIGAPGFRVPEDERLFDVHGDRALTARPGSGGERALLVVRGLDGEPIREIATDMHIPQTGIVRGDDVYFGGIDLGKDETDLDLATDRGVWVAHGDDPPVPLLAAGDGVAVYTTIERSPDGRTVGIWRCGETCSTLLVGPDGDVIEVPRPGLIALTNDVALLIGAYSDVTAFAIEDGAELWRAETPGVYYARYATTDGEGIVLSAIEDAGDADTTTDLLRIERIDATTGAVERSVEVPTGTTLLWIAPSLSTDRYVAILDSVLPDADQGPRTVRVVDLEAEVLLDDELVLGEVP